MTPSAKANQLKNFVKQNLGLVYLYARPSLGRFAVLKLFYGRFFLVLFDKPYQNLIPDPIKDTESNGDWK